MLRSKKKFLLDNGKTYLVRELTIGDLFASYYTVRSIDTGGIEELFSNLIANISLLESVTTCPWDVLINIGASDLKNIYDLFLEVNSSFFQKKNNKKSKNSAGKEEDFINNLFVLYCGLIEAGHTNVVDYGYSFFIRAINNHERIKSLAIAEIATANRAAYHSDDKQWKKYIRSLVGHNGY